MPSKRRNKGKAAPPPQPQPPTTTTRLVAAAATTTTEAAAEREQQDDVKAPPSSGDATTTAAAAAVAPSNQTESHPSHSPSSPPQLVLTSDKRRGIYECDYCHTDISQVPRIRCAVCHDFDLCLDCFATTDHSAAIARLRAIGEAHQAVEEEKELQEKTETTEEAAASAAATTTSSVVKNSAKTAAPGVSAAAAHHDETHGYRVADSTRYPLFPATRAVVVPSSRPSSVMAPMDNMDVDDVDEDEYTDKAQGKKMPSEDGQGKQDDSALVQDKLQVKEGSKEQEAKDNKDAPNKPEQDGPISMDVDVQVKQVEDNRQQVVEKAPTTKQADTAPQESSSIGLGMSLDDDDDDDDKAAAAEKTAPDSASDVVSVVHTEDPRSAWTVEEDLRLLDAIQTCGLGNWTDIAECVGGSSGGSSSKSAKRCMERYFDDFLGRYGHILPPYTLVEDENASDDEDNNDDETRSEGGDSSTRPSKRRRTERNLLRSQSSVSLSSVYRNRKKSKVVPTSSLPGYDEVWPDQYLPPLPGIEVGQEVGREHAMRAENAYVKTIANATSKEEAEKLRKEWMEKRLNQLNGPTVLPPRPEDVCELPGSELAGYMPRRGDFDIEWENDAEAIIADMEFSPSDLPQDRQLKIQVIEIYNSKLDERERRKEFLLSRNLLDYRKNQQADQRLPRDERDLVRRMRLFERFHTPQEHKQFVSDLLKAKRLRKEIAKLQMYRRMGIKTLTEAEKYELDKNRREYHKMAQLQKEQEVERAKAAAAKAAAAKEAALVGAGATVDDAASGSSLWKQYKTSDRKSRRSVNRSGSSVSALTAESSPDAESTKESVAAGVTEDEATESSEKKAADDSASKAETSTSVKTSGSTFDIVNSRGYELLSSKEVALCVKLHLLPSHYLQIKKALIQESLSRGLLDREGMSSNKRAIVKIDAEKRGDVVDFMVRAGWISTKIGASFCKATTS